jgi:hypothetical protein
MKNVFLQGLKCVAASLFLCAAALAQTPSPPIRLAMIEGLSGGNANGGEAVYRNLVWAVERVNERGGVRLARAAPGAWCWSATTARARTRRRCRAARGH